LTFWYQKNHNRIIKKMTKTIVQKNPTKKVMWLIEKCLNNRENKSAFKIENCNCFWRYSCLNTLKKNPKKIRLSIWEWSKTIVNRQRISTLFVFDVLEYKNRQNIPQLFVWRIQPGESSKTILVNSRSVKSTRKLLSWTVMWVLVWKLWTFW